MCVAKYGMSNHVAVYDADGSILLHVTNVTRARVKGSTSPKEETDPVLAASEPSSK